MPDERVLITGSRGLYSRRLLFASHVAAYFIRRGISLIVGDAPGVDLAVIEQANFAKYQYIRVVGAYGKVRYPTHYGKNIALKGTYPQRDVWMAPRCTHCLGIWDGQSHGTVITFNAASTFGKKTWVVTIPDDRQTDIWWQVTSPGNLLSLFGGVKAKIKGGRLQTL